MAKKTTIKLTTAHAKRLADVLIALNTAPEVKDNPEPVFTQMSNSVAGQIIKQHPGFFK